MALTDAMNSYLQGLYGIDVLPTDIEYKLSEAIQQGDDSALDKLVVHNLRFAIHVIKKMPVWINKSIDPEDLIGIANEQLIIAARKGIPKNNAKFCTFAKNFIIRGVRRELDNSSNMIRLPVNVAESIRKLNYTEKNLRQILGREPKHNELATMMGVTEDKISELRSYMNRQPSSLDELNSERFIEEEGLE